MNWIKGPWRAQINGRTVSILTVASDGTYGTAIALCQQVQKPSTIANAHLISAAPEMYETLTELVALVRGECPSLLNEDSGGLARLDIAIDAALRKAEGICETG